MKNKRVTTHYIDKRKFHAEMTAYRLAAIEAEKNGSPPPRINNYLGNCFYMLCEKLSYRPNFANYSFREEMVGDGIENCLAAVDNFNPNEQKQNPFGYFSLIAWRAFVRRIQKEQKQAYIKHKAFHNSGLLDELSSGSESHMVGASMMNNEVSNRIIENFESKLNTKKTAPVKGVEKFLD
jgi:DNA-directed RNA polymerase specialized sigma24 family protein